MISEQKFKKAKREVNEAYATLRNAIGVNADGTDAMAHKKRLIKAQTKLRKIKAQRTKEVHDGS